MPLFMSAPRVSISMDKAMIGFAIGLNFNISVDVQPIYAMGSYGPVALEPTFYNLVTGTIQVIRLSRPTARQAMIAAANTNSGKTDSKAIDWNGNGSSAATGGNTSVQLTADNPLAINYLYAHLNPAQVMISRLFDITVRLKVAAYGSTSLIKDGAAAGNASGMLNGATSAIDKDTVKQNQSSYKYTDMDWMTIQGCRITGRTTNITFGQIINEPLNFQGLLALPAGLGFDSDHSVQEGVNETI